MKNNQKQEDAFSLIEDHTAAHEGERRPHSTKVKAATYDGSTSWQDYKAHFQTCAEINNWSYLEKGLYLAVSLRGQAQGVMGNLCSNSKDTVEREKTESHRKSVRIRTGYKTTN